MITRMDWKPLSTLLDGDPSTVSAAVRSSLCRTWTSVTAVGKPFTSSIKGATIGSIGSIDSNAGLIQSGE